VNFASLKSKQAKRGRYFRPQLLELPSIEATTTSEGRYYHTPEGDLPSVTTVLGRKLDKSGLEIWRARVGEEEANRISTIATRRGSAIHDLAEKYLLDRDDYTTGAMPVNIATFETLRPILDSRVTDVKCIEGALWSNTLNTAGRVDLIASFDAIPSIIDFKTSKRIKTDSDILSYFLQATCYSMMLEERTGIITPNIVILMAVDHDDPLVFIKSREQYMQQMKDIFTCQ
jgi:genome maintenance exonuclease 1